MYVHTHTHKAASTPKPLGGILITTTATTINTETKSAATQHTSTQYAATGPPPSSTSPSRPHTREATQPRKSLRNMSVTFETQYRPPSAVFGKFGLLTNRKLSLPSISHQPRSPVHVKRDSKAQPRSPVHVKRDSKAQPRKQLRSREQKLRV